MLCHSKQDLEEIKKKYNKKHILSWGCGFELSRTVFLPCQVVKFGLRDPTFGCSSRQYVRLHATLTRSDETKSRKHSSSPSSLPPWPIAPQTSEDVQEKQTDI